MPPKKRPHSAASTGSNQASECGNSSSEDADATVTEAHPNFNIDTVAKKWTTYFKYIGHAKDSKSQLWRCSFPNCDTDVSVAKSSYCNAYRHYKDRHGQDLKTPVPRRPSPFQVPADVLQRRETKQQAFDRAVVELMAQDGVPLSLCDRPKFRALVATLDSKIQVKSRKLYTKNIANEVNDVVSFDLKLLLNWRV
jgi:hypothetical protein